MTSVLEEAHALMKELQGNPIILKGEWSRLQ